MDSSGRFPPTVVVLDYGSGNLRSAQRALDRAGAEVSVTADLDRAAAADGLVVPGVGAYAACMAGITEIGAAPVLADRISAGRPVLGICVGMQILFDFGVEHGERAEGLGLLPGGVTRLGLLPGDTTRPGDRQTASGLRVPHLGWNTVSAPAGSALFADVRPDTRFYFVHSYAARPDAALRATGAVITTTDHGGEFVAAIELGCLAATQFHPEKSGAAGAAVLRSWVAALAPGRDTPPAQKEETPWPDR